jgi:hypothetical protein
MITNSGKEVLSKYLLGQAPGYATHIAVGCGALPLDPDDEFPEDIAAKETLDFEMLRVPISSRGFVEEDGVTKISLTAQLPTENRYEISEIGLWSAANNSLARGFDSRIIFDFEENWQAHDVTVRPIILKEPLGAEGNIEDSGDKVFRVSCDNSILAAAQRYERKEGPRFLNTSIFMRGDSSNITSNDIVITTASSDGLFLTYNAANTFSAGDKVTISGCSNPLFNVAGAPIVSATESSFVIRKRISSEASSLNGIAWISGSWTPEENLDDENGFVSEHIHLSNIVFNVGSNSPSDILTFAFSIVDKNAIGNGNPEYVKLIIEFFRNEITPDVGYAKTEIYIPGGNFANRYKAVKIPISDLITSPDFTPSEIRIARIYAFIATEQDSEIIGSEDHYIAIDGLRLDNVSTNNPLYKMVGYSPTRTDDGKPIIKFKNTNNYVEFRFGLGVT